MAENQPPTRRKLLLKATRTGRIIAVWILLISLAVCILLFLASHGVIDIGRYVGVCGMKMRYGLPCPTCGFTTAAIAFFNGNILKAFYIQPAGALLCVALLITVFLAFITAVFGVYFPFLKNLAGRIRTWQIVLAIIVALAAAWAVTLSRALAQRGQ
jgi:hypothetical protein